MANRRLHADPTLLHLQFIIRTIRRIQRTTHHTRTIRLIIHLITTES